jgi:hypothetical protein
MLMDLRELKALEIAARSRVSFENGAWVVPSQSGGGVRYKVRLDPASCECEDFQLRGPAPCKHVIAVYLVVKCDHGGKAPTMDTDEVPKKPTYRQDWPA